MYNEGKMKELIDRDELLSECERIGVHMARKYSIMKWRLYLTWIAVVSLAAMCIGLGLWASKEYATLGSVFFNVGLGVGTALIILALLIKYDFKGAISDDEIEVNNLYKKIREDSSRQNVGRDNLIR